MITIAQMQEVYERHERSREEHRRKLKKADENYSFSLLLKQELQKLENKKDE